jgi:hypothetical protein
MSEPLVLDLLEVADVLKLTARTPTERRRQVRDLIEAGELNVISRRVGPRRWTVSRFEVLRYVGHPDYSQRGAA